MGVASHSPISDPSSFNVDGRRTHGNNGLVFYRSVNGEAVMNLFTSTPQDTATDANSQQFLMRQFHGKAFITLALVTSVSESGEVCQ
jgi:hypothetical protein